MAAATLTSLLLLLFCCLLSQQDGVTAVRIKIKLDPENLAIYTQHYKRNGSYSDSVQIQRSNVTLYGNLKQLGNDVKFWRSAVAKRIWHCLVA